MSSFTRGARVQRKAATPATTTQPEAAAALVEASIASPAPSSASAVDTPLAAPATPALSVPSAPAPARPSAAGCRSWIHGLTLTSTGVAGLDSVLGGGASLGNIVAYKDATPFDSACAPVVQPFASSFLADGVAFGHRVLLVTPASRAAAAALLQNLPRNTTIEKRQQTAEAAAVTQKEAAADQQRQDLKIAWRYQQQEPLHAASGGGKSRPSSSASARSVSSATLSSTYDYHSAISPQLLQANPPQVLSIQDDILPVMPSLAEPLSDAHRTALVYRHALEGVHSFLSAAPAGSVSRVLLQSLGSPGWHAHVEEQARPLQLFLAHLRQMVADQAATLAVFTLDAALMPPALVRSVSHYADVVLSISGFSAAAAASAKVLGDYDGIIRLERCAPRHSLVGASGRADEASGASAASGHCFLYKLTRRAIVVEKFALPPEAEDEGGEQAPVPQASVAPVITTRGTTAVRAKERRIEYEDSAGAEDAGSQSVLGASLARHNVPAAASGRKQVDAPLHAILQGRSSVSMHSGCSNSHQLPGHKMDF